MAEYSKIARGSFISTGNAQVIPLPFQPTIVRFTNYTATGDFTASGITSAFWDVAMGQGTAAVDYVASGSPNALQPAVVASSGISTFSQGLALQYGPKLQISGIVKSTSTVTTVAPHGYSSGDVVIFQGLYQSPTTGMPQICGIPFEIVVASPTTFTFQWDINQSNFTALSGSPAGAYVKKVLNPYLFFPGVNIVEALATNAGDTMIVTTTVSHNYVKGQEVAFRIPLAYASVELNSLPNSVSPGNPIYTYVTEIVDNFNFVVNLAPFGGAFTAFFTNIAVSAVPGLQFPQVLAVGDVNTGGVQYSGGALYPSPVVITSVSEYPTINGPAIQGAFVNNSQQGFVIGNGHAIVGGGSADAASSLSGAEDDLICWEAEFTDFGS